MSEASETTTTQPDTTGAAKDFTPITSQEDLDKIIGQRVGRMKAQYADYDDLKTKAAEFDKVADQSKSELQKMADRIAATENELKAERLNSLKATVAASKGVPANVLTGSTVEELEESADELLAWRGKQAARTSSGLKSGATNSDNRMDPKEKAANALRSYFNT